MEDNFSDNLTDNEVDLLFIVSNRIYIVESKASIEKNKVNTTALSNYLYKLAAINKRFGLNAKATLMTFSDFTRLSNTSYKNLQKRSKILDLYFPIDRNKIIDNKLFSIEINNLLK